MQDDYVVVGVLARIDTTDPDGVRQRLNALDGVETFDLAEPEKLGIVVEATGIDDAHDRLRHEVDATVGVLGTWPVAMEMDSDDSEVTTIPDPIAD